MSSLSKTKDKKDFFFNIMHFCQMNLKLDSWQCWWFISESPLIGMPILVSLVYVTVVSRVIAEVDYI